MAYRDRRGRFIAREAVVGGLRAGQAVYRAVQGGLVAVGVGVGVRTNVQLGDVRYKSPSYHQHAMPWVTRHKGSRTRQHSYWREPYRKKYKTKSKYKRKSSYKKKTYKKKAYKMKGKGAKRSFINAHTWPPTELRATFQTHYDWPVGSAMSADPDALGAQQLTVVDSWVPEDCRMFNQNTGSGVAPVGVKIDGLIIAPAMQDPRNWDAISANYTRCRHVKSHYTLTFFSDTADTLTDQRSYDFWWWRSSDQDDNNPMVSGASGTADSAYISGAWHNILSTSRRVHHRVMRPSSVGQTKFTIKFTLDHHKDRLKNSIGGHVSVITNHPMGVLHAMDTTVAAYESTTALRHGVDNKMTIVWCPTDRKAGQLQRIGMHHHQTVDFYDRIIATT